MEKIEKIMSISFHVCVILTLDCTTTPDPFIATVGDSERGKTKTRKTKVN